MREDIILIDDWGPISHGVEQDALHLNERYRENPWTLPFLGL
jgi:hypothetical protein